MTEDTAEKKVLIVEDNDLNLKLFKDLLEAHDLDSIETRDGAEAIALIEAEKPTLIIMDIQLPNISGLDLIKEIKSRDDLKEIPVVAVTAFAMLDDEREILEAGCEDYLAKPISIVSFIETVKKYI